jgi:two-component system cell cycle response regulator
MPGLDGIEICRRIRSVPNLAAMYILMLTGRDARADLISALDAGADDYMTKPVDTDELRARVQVGLRMATLQSRLTERVSELQDARDHLAQIASTDALTHLYSRRTWFELAAAEFSRSRRYGRPLSVLALDLDFFKQVNDKFGHEGGDRLLQSFAETMRLASRHSDVIGRIGGEEFAWLVPETALGSAGMLADRILAGCRMLRVPTSAGEVSCSCSIGVAELEPPDDSFDSLLRRADGALYHAKRSGRDQWKGGDPDPRF